MQRGFSAWLVWTQVPVGNRTVEVNTKTGFSLTAGSYATRASSTQRGTITVTTTSNTASISSVTVTRAHEGMLGRIVDAAAGGSTEDMFEESCARIDLTNATTVTATLFAAPGASGNISGFVVPEYF